MSREEPERRPPLPMQQQGEMPAKKRRRRPAAPSRQLSRSERQRRQVRRSKRRQMVRRAAFLLLTLCVGFLAVTVFFRVDKLRVTGTQHYSAEDITAALDIEQGDNLFSFRTASLQKRLLKKYPYLSRVEIERQLPDTLLVKAIDAVPVMAVDLEGGGSFLADANGKLLEQAAAAPEGVAPITGVIIEDGKPGKMLPQEGKVKILLSVTQALNEAQMMGDVDFINVSSSYDIRFGFMGRLDVRLGEATRLQEKLRMLERIVEKELSPSDIKIVYLADPKTAYCPPTTLEQIELSMLPLKDEKAELPDEQMPQSSKAPAS